MSAGAERRRHRGAVGAATEGGGREPLAPAGAAAPVLYFDLASPYSYLAVMRARLVLPVDPFLQPVLAGAIFAHRGWGSWALTSAREQNVVEIERRAAEYGLAIAWPRGWPPNSLLAQRAAIHAQRRGLARQFAQAAYLMTYGEGEALSETTVLAAGESIGIGREELSLAVRDPKVKLALREATDDAIALGVRGVPTLAASGELHFGDDSLELAAARLRAAPGSAQS